MSTKSAYQWHPRLGAGAPRRWRPECGGRLRQHSFPGCVPHGSGPGRLGLAEGQRWTLERVTHGDRAAVPRPLHAVRHFLSAAPDGFTPQVPVHRTEEHDEAAIAGWQL